MIFAFEFLGYWLHRAFHKIPALWELHKYHHSATDFCIVTARRDHPLVVPIFIVFAGIPTGLLGAPAEEVVWMTGIITVHAMLIHSELGGSWGLLGRWLVVSPRGHRIHHSMLPEHLNKNFGFFTPLWDRVFGTFHLPDRVVGEVIPIGVDDPVYNAKPLHEELTWGAVQAARRLLPSTKTADERQLTS